MPKNRVAPFSPAGASGEPPAGTAAARGACSCTNARAAPRGFEYDTGRASARRRRLRAAEDAAGRRRARVRCHKPHARERAGRVVDQVHDVQRSAGGERLERQGQLGQRRALGTRRARGERARVLGEARRAELDAAGARPRERACPAPDRDGRACCLPDGRRDVYRPCDAQRHAPRQEERREVFVAVDVDEKRPRVVRSPGARRRRGGDTAIGRSSIERSAFWKPTSANADSRSPPTTETATAGSARARGEPPSSSVRSARDGNRFRFSRNRATRSLAWNAERAPSAREPASTTSAAATPSFVSTRSITRARAPQTRGRRRRRTAFAGSSTTARNDV